MRVSRQLGAVAQQGREIEELRRQHASDQVEIRLLREQIARLEEAIATYQAGKRGRRGNSGGLSEAERDVLFWLAQGYNDEQIAQKRRNSARTIRWYVWSILAKLGLKNRTQAARYAWSNGIVDPVEAWEVVKTLQWRSLPEERNGDGRTDAR